MEAVQRVHLFHVAVIWLCASSCGVQASQDNGPVVTTVTGQVRGTTTHTTDLPDKPIYTFLGIPYAAPPVGNLRYRPPQPAVPWEGVRDAVEVGHFCSQNATAFNKLDFPLKWETDGKTSEDCLTLNIFTPTVAADSVLPVLLWIHGGAFFLGMGSPPGFESLAAHQDVVVVSINYRLGVLGFLSTGDDNIPGNYGFLDQIRAMEWVKENIRNFGGDPDRVTIFGESAGGDSVSCHLLSPLSKGLFQRAISQSGTCQTFPVEPQTIALMVGEAAGCDLEDTAALATCLKEIPPQELLDIHESLHQTVGELPFMPIVDGTFLTADPAELLRKGEVNTADYLLGFNNHEFGWLMLSDLTPGDVHVGMSHEDFAMGVMQGLEYKYPGNPNAEKMAEAIVKEYRDPTTPDDPLSIQYQYSQMWGDLLMVAPTVSFADHHAAAGGRVFLYENEYRPSIHPNRPDWVRCDHCDDLFMVWGLPFLKFPDPPIEYTREDEMVSLSMMAYWANFARTGDPSDSTGGPPDSPSLPTWPQYTPDNPVYMKLDVEPTTGSKYKPEKMKLWNEVITRLAAKKILLQFYEGVATGEDGGLVVTTVTGQVRGTTTHTTDLPDKPIYTFLGVPYAAPPVGDLRYRPPQPAVPWEGVRDAVEYGSYCPQNLLYFNMIDFPIKLGMNMTMSEDCLTLNIYTPTVKTDVALPVLLWIHGGALSVGMGAFPGFESLAAHQDVVVVSINYRLGVLGFLSTGDDNMPGNYGFLDQVRAMEWVRENIRNFGGDPGRVTIFGDSAGGVSVSYHLLSPLSNGLFRRAISQSGVYKTMPVNPQPLQMTKMLAEAAACNTKDTSTITTCLKKKTVEELLEKVAPIQQMLGLLTFLPVVDGVFLKSDPTDQTQTGEGSEVNPAEYLLGVNNHVFGWIMLPTTQRDPLVGSSKEEFINFVKAVTLMSYQGNQNLDKMADTIVADYRHPTTPEDPMSILYQLSHAFGDFMFVGPTVLAADKHAANGGRIFLYENEYRPSIHPNRPDWVGCDHMDDLFMVLGLPFVDVPGTPIDYSKTDEHVSLSMMAYWANFARTGDPSDSTGGPPDSPSLPTWPQYTPDNPVYMKLDVVPTTGVGLKTEKVKLWNEIVPKLAAVKKDEL
ncbi:PREDICTED: neuroligin-3-like [Branchiostoma belcheri]|uniref:Neuroligin-3-like n=1 Tax=Branchiostoma belcheri TaxID=7741 RepID=A0A6P5AFF6_BRABE|nr:PREDICTED: neuroligin-3-like [Branchiostoma belcheri]